MSSPARASRWVCISVLLVLAGTLCAAIAPAAEGKIVELASGRYAGRDWAFAVNGPREERCLVLQTIGGGWGGEGTICEEDEPISRYWDSGSAMRLKTMPRRSR